MPYWADRKRTLPALDENDLTTKIIGVSTLMADIGVQEEDLDSRRSYLMAANKLRQVSIASYLLVRSLRRTSRRRLRIDNADKMEIRCGVLRTSYRIMIYTIDRALEGAYTQYIGYPHVSGYRIPKDFKLKPDPASRIDQDMINLLAYIPKRAEKLLILQKRLRQRVLDSYSQMICYLPRLANRRFYYMVLKQYEEYEAQFFGLMCELRYLWDQYTKIFVTMSLVDGSSNMSKEICLALQICCHKVMHSYYASSLHDSSTPWKDFTSLLKNAHENLRAYECAAGNFADLDANTNCSPDKRPLRPYELRQGFLIPTSYPWDCVYSSEFKPTIYTHVSNDCAEQRFMTAFTNKCHAPSEWLPGEQETDARILKSIRLVM